MTIRAVLFDLGDTLMHPVNHDWPAIIHAGNISLAERLCQANLGIDCESFPQEFNTRLHEYYRQRDVDMLETSTFQVLKELLAEKGCGEVPDAIIREGLDGLYTVTQRNWELEEDAIPCLEALLEAGFKLGIVSNAGDNKDVFQLVDKFSIEPFFDFVLTSAACGFRKPHRQIFEVALAHWGFHASEAAMVGDRLDADVLGANQMGIFSIWITRRAGKKQMDEIQPRAVVEHLSEIPPLMQGNV
jgi:putative hydrolase of the HAD superfamily